tara:strand:- start:1489 stop:1833 length:345 start_codon:yes stop_codon:yes gene_type:complete
MKHVKLFEDFIKEEAIKAGPESEVTINDMTTTNGTEISSEEILGIIVSSDAEENAVDKMYDKFGQTSFSEEDMSTFKAMYNEYYAEVKELEKEAEEEADVTATDGEDPTADLDI